MTQYVLIIASETVHRREGSINYVTVVITINSHLTFEVPHLPPGVSLEQRNCSGVVPGSNPDQYYVFSHLFNFTQ